MVKRAAKKVAPKKSAPVEEPVIDETVVLEEATEEVVEAAVEESAEEMETESQDNEEVTEETETVDAEVDAENAENEAEHAENEAENAENEAENEDENEEETVEGETKREPKVNTYVTTHPDEFAGQIMKDIKNDFNTANRRGGPRNNGKKDMLRIRQKRAQLSLDTIIVYGDREYRNCSSVPLMSLSFTLRETIQKYRKSISAGKRDEVCPDKLHHTIIKVDNDLGVNGLRAVIKWMHTGDLNLTAENFEEIVAVVLYFRIKMLRQSLVKLGRKVGIKFVPVPANEKTIARREKEGKPTLPNGFEEAEKLEDGEEALPEDAKVVEGKDVLAKIKSAAKIAHLKEIPGTSQKKEGGNRNQKNKNSGNSEVKKEGENKTENKENTNKRQQNRKRSNIDNKIDESGDAKKSKMADVKKENGTGNKGERRNNTSGGARGARATGNRGTFTSTRGGARGGSNSAGKSIYRENSQQAQSQLQQSYAPPQANYFQPTYHAPQAYGYAPPQYQQPMPHGYQQQQPFQGQYRQPQQGNNQGYYGGR